MALRRKTKTAYFCCECGAEHTRWQGQCRGCGQWNKLIEQRISSGSKQTRQAEAPVPAAIPEIRSDSRAGWQSGIAEFDRVLGGQLLEGMTVLLGGEPGIGKSTLLLQVADAYSCQSLKVLYVTGEESLSQIKLRADRLRVKGTSITVMNSTALEEITDALEAESFNVVLVDSIQTTVSSAFDSPPGTVAQVRESAQHLINLAKTQGFALFLVGHVTKDGMVAGPKVLEHMVDTVVYFEGDRTHLYRVLRAAKNRFGSISEIGLFEMKPEGLAEVADPSSLFLSERDGSNRSGTVVAGLCEGNRPLLVEVQALVTEARYGNPQRVAGGFDNKRLALLLAILEKRCGYPMALNDVFVSIAGGLRFTEPALDLSVMAAIVSSHLNRSVSAGAVAVGEVGLSGEVRNVTMMDRRLNEAARMGFKRIVLPKQSASNLPASDIEVVAVSDVQAALEILTE